MAKTPRIYYRIRNRYRVYLFRIALLLLAGLLLFLGIDAKLKPMIREYAKSNAAYLAGKAIHDAVNREIGEQGIQYTDLVTLEKDNTGKVTALYTNIVKLNSLQSQFADLVLDELQEIESSVIEVPLGNATGIDFFSGRGPNIPIEIIPLGSVDIACGSEFTSGGINQTQHRLIMTVTASVTVLLPRDSVTASVTSDISIAETILVGTVPESFTNIVDTRDLIEQGIDYTLE